MAEAQTYLSKCISQKRSIYSNRTVSYVIVLLELLTVLLEYIDLSVIAIFISKNSYYYTNILPIMLALCSMLSGIYYAHNYASIIGRSLQRMMATSIAVIDSWDTVQMKTFSLMPFFLLIWYALVHQS